MDLKPPETLQKLEVPVIGRDACNTLYQQGAPPLPGTRDIQEDMMCAGYPQGGRDACQVSARPRDSRYGAQGVGVFSTAGGPRPSRI